MNVTSQAVLAGYTSGTNAAVAKEAHMCPTPDMHSVTANTMLHQYALHTYTMSTTSNTSELNNAQLDECCIALVTVSFDNVRMLLIVYA
jgi:hypothetical protein